MKKPLLIGILFVLAIGGYFYSQSQPAGQTGSVQEAANEAFSGNLMDAMKRNLPMHCTWSRGEDSGEAYVKGDNIYTETQVEGQMAYMARKDGCSYIWGGGQDTALKICDDETATEMTETQTTKVPDYAPNSAAGTADQGPDLSVEYNCQPTVISDDKFNPPTDVEFTDMQEMMDKMMQGDFPTP